MRKTYSYSTQEFRKPKDANLAFFDTHFYHVLGPSSPVLDTLQWEILPMCQKEDSSLSNELVILCHILFKSLNSWHYRLLIIKSISDIYEETEGVWSLPQKLPSSGINQVCNLGLLTFVRLSFLIYKMMGAK